MTDLVSELDFLSDADVALIVERFTKEGIIPDNNQAMALVKKFDLMIEKLGKWGVTLRWSEPLRCGIHSAVDADLNRAIVECVAKRQKEKRRDQ